MPFFGCPHRWRKLRRPNGGYQQYVCGKCGKLRRRKVSKWAQTFCSHKWRLDRRTKPPLFRCKKCAKTKEAQYAH